MNAEAIAQLQQQLNNLSLQLASLQGAQEPQQASTQMVEDDEDDEFDTPSDWAAVPGDTKVSASSPVACALCDLLEHPPPLELLKGPSQSACYAKIPETPSSRKHPIDQKLQIPQKKMEIAMHKLVLSLDTNDTREVQTAAAFIRSAWEDLQQQRRELVAGRNKNKLDRRPDDTKARLLTPEEEAKVRPPPPPSRHQWGKPSGGHHDFHGQSAHKGGKGQGKGRRKFSPAKKP